MNSLEPKPTTSVIGDILSHLSNLVRKEVDLAKSEIRQNLGRAGTAIGLLVGAVVLILVALNVLAAAAVAAMAEAGMNAGLAALIVGAVLLIVAAIMAFKGKSDLSAKSLAPTRTAENLRRDATALKEQING
ncbi:phage holin family protein [Silicimonas algicola]|uniref:Putative superfamily III holin-X n=1 Tax=Silicimonas algicola TaxID=1826607 RepID=A0A316GA28_9RHOB|nr:phage holin family protein [Silicimonas algicola]AZQ67372.1 phage holin family protein [Silicimonas algicola]PWK57055.1 putative superfamily III holin-X [Silicimonas algicola]